jgi:putative FmdB family regulatory protein
MPFYEYQCRACGAQVEVMQKISDAPLKKCPECGRNMLTKLVSAPVFRLKGGGWYETDFKTDQDKKRNLVEADKAESKADDKKETTTDTKAETKPESRPEPKADASPKPDAKPAAKPVKKKAVPRARGRARRR